MSFRRIRPGLLVTCSATAVHCSRVRGRMLTIGSSDGTSASGSLGYSKVVDRWMGGATSFTRFSELSACSACVEGCILLLFRLRVCLCFFVSCCLFYIPFFYSDKTPQKEKYNVAKRNEKKKKPTPANFLYWKELSSFSSRRAPLQLPSYRGLDLILSMDFTRRTYSGDRAPCRETGKTGRPVKLRRDCSTHGYVGMERAIVCISGKKAERFKHRFPR